MRLLVLLTLFCFACGSQSQNHAEPFSSPADKFDSLQVEVLKDTNPREQSRQMRLDSIGDLELIGIERGKKCNLTTGYYVLKATSIDSADLAFLTRDFNRQLHERTRNDENCDYPKMTNVFVYARKEDYYENKGDYVSMCQITPEFPRGDVFVNLLKYKSAILDK